MSSLRSMIVSLLMVIPCIVFNTYLIYDTYQVAHNPYEKSSYDRSINNSCHCIDYEFGGCTNRASPSSFEHFKQETSKHFLPPAVYLTSQAVGLLYLVYRLIFYIWDIYIYIRLAREIRNKRYEHYH